MCLLQLFKNNQNLKKNIKAISNEKLLKVASHKNKNKNHHGSNI